MFTRDDSFHFDSINMKYVFVVLLELLHLLGVLNAQSPGQLSAAGTYGSSRHHSYPRYSSSSYGTSSHSSSIPCGGLIQGLIQRGGTQTFNLGSVVPLISGLLGSGGSSTSGIQYVVPESYGEQNIFGSGGSSILSGLLGSVGTQTGGSSGSGFSSIFGGSPLITSRISGQRPVSNGGSTFVLNQGSAVQNPLQSLLGGASLSSILQSPSFRLPGNSAQNTAISNFIRMISRVPSPVVPVTTITTAPQE